MLHRKGPCVGVYQVCLSDVVTCFTTGNNSRNCFEPREFIIRPLILKNHIYRMLILQTNGPCVDVVQL